VGTPQAITATAHTRARLSYALLKPGTAYGAGRRAEYEQKYRQRVVHHLSRKARALGDELVAKREAVSPGLSGRQRRGVPGKAGKTRVIASAWDDVPTCYDDGEDEVGKRC